MAGSLRELVATFGINFDPSGAKKASTALDKLGAQAKGQVAGTMVQSAQAATAQTNVLANAIKGLGLIVAARAVARGFGFIVSAASDADETLNVLQASFGKSTQGVLDFAEKTAAEVGRSEFVIRDFAGRIGALVAPAFASMGEAGEEQTAKVSKDFSKLAVDLASFFNTTEEQAITALRSGISGESEPLKQFGVNLTEQGIADALGIDAKAFRAMDRAEKTMARHRAIMIQTKNAQGDAARTAEGFANASRAVQSALLDTAVSIGQKILPAVETLTRYTRDTIRWFGNLVKRSHIVESALLVAGAAALFFGTRAIWAARRTVMAWAAALWPFALMVLIIDEVWTTMEGGESVINDLLSWITGIEGAGKIWTDAMQAMGGALYDLLNGGGVQLEDFINAWFEGLDTIYQYFVNIWGSIKDFVRDAVGSMIPDGPVGDIIKKGFSLSADVAGFALENMSPLAPVLQGAEMIGDFTQSRVSTPINSSNVVQPAAPININVNGGTGSPRDTGKEVEKGVRRALSEDRRKVTNAVGG